jgi:predicted DCC family thiol-disulfide oxidoreductase YuxK
MTGATPSSARIVLFDGVCGMCNAIVSFLVRVDRRRAFRYAPLQGTTAEELRRAHPEIPGGLESMVLVDDGVVFLRMKAVARGARYLPWPWKIGYAIFWLPRWLSDPLYNLVARVRYRVFGKREACRVPGPGERELFLP